jgi:anti-sigma regulatory factor (Ser/Thr protein kinase)
MLRELTLHNDVKQIELLTEFIEVLCEELGLDAMLTFNLNLVLEEAVTNVIMYAYPQDEDHTMTLKTWTEQSDNIIVFELKDQGKPFNPIEEAPEVDTTLSADERQIGGLGIFLINKIMDDVTYRYEEGSNILTMKKNIKA